jgi:hypothetical protein
MTVFDITYPVRDDSSVETVAKNVVQYCRMPSVMRTRKANVAYLTACGIVPGHLFLPNFNPYRILKKEKVVLTIVYFLQPILRDLKKQIENDRHLSLARQ